MLVAKQVSDLQANQTEAENEKYAQWSGYLNTWGGQVKYATTYKSIALRGMYSYYYNYKGKKDRRWQFYGQTYPSGMLLAGSSTNEYWSKATLIRKTFNVYRADAVIVAAASNFYTAYNDRVFYFKFKKINTQAWYRKSWAWTGYSLFNKAQKGFCGSGWMMGVYSIYSSSYNDRRFNVLCGMIAKKAVTTPAWVTNTHAVAKSTTVTNSVSVTRKK
jgi:hypothetical protein